ncbi:MULTISPECIES: DUF3040 domain-containing protein [unclassified Streptomyces]|jgi:hypothetical protein|uniref:DUF3040 domain-containing protein n=1 Tax=unclassified Streptomyces TaxID=2593676 RepID=UPI0004AAF168|nr:MULTISPECIES: DUF3040 domain-containing protein [unclassified Streptomyces]APU43626.1 hypothetical protein BSL84_31700 [Streptomyces sp. TN58]KJK51372.1 hypothetical protein UK14_11605 [Streptomyces sp. NRRL F-4428]
MDGAGLSDREQRALAAIEAELRGDRALDRMLRSGRRRRRAVWAGVWAAVTAALFVAASAAVSEALLWGCAAALALTVVTALPPAVERVRRIRGRVRPRTEA